MTLRSRKLATAAPVLLFLAGVALAAPQRGRAPQFPAGQYLSADETIAQARDYDSKMHDVQRNILKLQDQAKKQRDIVKLNCVNDKLMQVRSHIQIGSQTMSNLDLALAKGDDSGRSHEYTRMTILYQKVLGLGEEAEQCMGEDINYIGETRVDVIVDPNIPNEDPTEPVLPLPDVTRPPEASPFV